MAAVVPALLDGQIGTATSDGGAVTLDVVYPLFEITTTTASEVFTFPASGTVNVNVDWGDGSSVETFTSTPISHTFATAGTYNVRVSGTIDDFKVDGSGQEARFAGDVIWAGLAFDGTVNLSNAFRDSDITTLDGRGMDLSACTSLYYAFENCSSLTTLDVSSWDLSACTTLDSTFYNCSSLTTLDVSSWNLSVCTSLESAFRACSSLTSLDVSSWNLSACTTLIYAFRDCSSLTSLNASSWGLSSCTTLGYAFYNCSSLTSLNVSSWDLSACTVFTNAFYGCALDQTTVDAILARCVAGGQTGTIRLDIDGGTNSPPSTTGLADKATLESRGWTVNVNS